MRENFIIATDSACDLPIEYCRQNEIIPMKFRYTIDDKIFEDSMNSEEAKTFYNNMRDGKQPKTSQINIDDYISFWSTLDYENYPILHLTMGSAISGTYQNGLTARDIFLSDHPNAEIVLIDSTLSSIGHGMLLIKAVEMKAKGSSLEEITEWTEKNKRSINTLVTTADLKYLYRGGRVKKSRMIIANALNIKPILNLDVAGNLKVFEKARGKKDVYEKIQKIFKSTYNKEEKTLFIAHADAEADAKELGEKLKKAFNFKNVFYTYIGAVVGSHTGPGTLSVFYFSNPRTDD